MARYEEIRQINISYDDIIEAINYAREHSFRDNLRDRNNLVKFDTKVRGHLGEMAIKHNFETFGIAIENIDSFVDGSYEDIDFVVSNSICNDIIVEVKTSLIPDVWQTLNETMMKGDIKIIKRESSYHDIRADYHIQIYFGWLRRQRDNFLQSLNYNLAALSSDEIINALRYNDLTEFLVAWMDKGTLIDNLNATNVNSRTWHFGARDFWHCELEKSNAPGGLVHSINQFRR